MKDKEIVNRAMKVMPGGVSSPVRALKAVASEPLFVNKGRGAFIWDVEGKDYVDLCMSFGPLILGHANPAVVNELKSAVENGTTFGVSTPHEVELAERITKLHPTTEWVRFVNSGTEAVMSVMRLARGITGRDLIIKFNGCYHGHVDSMLVKSGSGLATFGISSSAGVPDSVSKHTIVLNLGSIEEVKSAFEKFPDQIAAVVIEGIPANNGLLIQSQSYMQELEKVTKTNGALFILDEVITGFRIGFEGAAGYYGLDPDLVAMGKVIGGGLPVGLYGGKIQYMEYIAPLGNVYQAGTLSGNPLAMTAGNVTLRIIEEENVYPRLEKLGASISQSIKEIFVEQGQPLSIRRVGSIFWLIMEDDIAPFTPDEVNQEMVDRYSTIHKSSMTKGIYLPPSAYEVAFLSLAHESQADELISRMRSAIQI